jgi:hypothetical protein
MPQRFLDTHSAARRVSGVTKMSQHFRTGALEAWLCWECRSCPRASAGRVAAQREDRMNRRRFILLATALFTALALAASPVLAGQRPGGRGRPGQGRPDGVGGPPGSSGRPDGVRPTNGGGRPDGAAKPPDGGRRPDGATGRPEGGARRRGGRG